MDSIRNDPNVDWKPIYISGSMVILSIALLYYEQVLEILHLLKVSLNMFQGMISNRYSLSHLLFGWLPYLLGIKHEYGFGSRSTAQQIALKHVDNLYNHTIIVTGGNSGIGYSLCSALSEVSHQQSETINSTGNHRTQCCIIMASRNTTKSETAIKQILTQFPKAHIRLIALDLGKAQSIISFINTLKQLPSNIQNNIKILINNAGIGMIIKAQSVTFDDCLDQRFEKAFAVNYLGPFMLTQLMFDRYFKNNGNECIIVNTSSIIHTVASSYWEQDFPSMKDIALYHLNNQYNHVMSYGLSKLFNIVHAKMMADEYKKHKVLINACNPGTCVLTGIHGERSLFVAGLVGISNKLLWFLWKSSDQCAATSMLLLCDETIKSSGITGAYFEDCGIKDSSNFTKNQIILKKLKEYSFSIYNSIKK